MATAGGPVPNRPPRCLAALTGTGPVFGMAIATSRRLARHHLGFDNEVEHEDER